MNLLIITAIQRGANGTGKEGVLHHARRHCSPTKLNPLTQKGTRWWFIFSPRVNSLLPGSAIHVLYSFLMWLLRHAFHTTSSAWMNLVQSPGTIAVSIFKWVTSAHVAWLVWQRYASQTNRRVLKLSWLMMVRR